MSTMTQPRILIIDLSSQVTTLIGRTYRELGYRSVIFGPKGAMKWLETEKPQGVILSGGAQSVFDEDALSPPKEVLDLGVPIFAICYGMQWLAHVLGGQVVSNAEKLGHKNYGDSLVKINSLNSVDPVFKQFAGKEYRVWASHGDSVEKLPPGFREVGCFQPSGTMAAMANPEKSIFAVQFHPEVKETPIGKEILENFVRVCGCQKDWSGEDFIENARREMQEIIGGSKVLLGYSGGVDSSVVSALAYPVLGNRLLALTIDTGALREGELVEIISNGRASNANLSVIDASEQFFTAIGDEIDAEKKRKLFQSVYGPCLDSFGKSFGATFLLQGTNKADKIETGKEGESSHIKSHHNMAYTELIKCNPLGELFKYEIRDIARKLGLPESISERQPFPGPGLFLRVNGIPANWQNIATVRWANAIVAGIFEKHGINKEISQFTVNLNGVPTVGIKGDKRSYKYSIVIHPVVTLDFMTSVGFQIPGKIRREITSEVQRHPEIVRVLYDEGDKPPASTEWE